jgi:chromosome segregation ATPase
MLESELRLAFRRFKQNQENLDAKHKLLEARLRSLAAAKTNLSKAASDRDTLFTRVEHLKARVREEKALEAASASYEVDSSTLADVTGILDRCQKRLDVLRQVRTNREGMTITLSEEEILPTGDVIEEVEQYFSGDSESATSTSAAVLTNDFLLVTSLPAVK